jgi:hypothetical protein
MLTLHIDRLHELLIYQPETGLFFWKVQRSGKTKAGVLAGSKNGSGYINLRIDYLAYGAHRAAWAMHYGVWPDGDIDHINGNRADNRIENLRDVPRSTNLQNQRKAHRDNTTGYLGVSKRGDRFRAKIMRNYRLYDLGEFLTADEASAAYQAAKQRLHDQPA